MPKKAGTQFLPFLDILIKQKIATFEQLPDGTYAICFNCGSSSFVKAAVAHKISSKETAFLKNLSNYGFKKHDKDGNKKRYHCKHYQPGNMDIEALIKRCKEANDVCNSKKRKKNESGDSTKNSKMSKMGEQFGGLSFESDMVQIQPDTITRKKSSVFVGNSRIRANNTKELRCVKSLKTNIDLTDSTDLDNSLNNTMTADVSITDVSQPPVFFPVANYQVLSEDTVPLADHQKLQFEMEQLKKELQDERNKVSLFEIENSSLKQKLALSESKVQVHPEESVLAEPVNLFSTYGTGDGSFMNSNYDMHY